VETKILDDRMLMRSLLQSSKNNISRDNDWICNIGKNLVTLDVIGKKSKKLIACVISQPTKKRPFLELKPAFLIRRVVEPFPDFLGALKNICRI